MARCLHIRKTLSFFSFFFRVIESISYVQIHPEPAPLYMWHLAFKKKMFGKYKQYSINS